MAESIDNLIKQTEKFIEKSLYSEAIILCDEIITRDKNNSEGYFLRGKIKALS